MRRAPKIFWTVFTLLLGATATWAMVYFRPQVKTKDPEVLPPLVRSQVVQERDIRIDVKTEGTVAARTEISLATEVSGKVTMVAESLAAGGFFSKDDVLVQLDDRDYKLAIAQANVKIAQAKLVLSREEAEAEVARREWKELGKGKPTPLTLREPHVREAKAGVAAAEAELAKAELDLERTTIKAPFDGRVRAKHVDVGQFVNRGTMLARIYAVDYAEVRLPLHDSEIQYLDLPLVFQGESACPGKTCKATLSTKFAGREQQWEALIVRTEGEIDAKSRMVHAIARVKNPYARSDDPDRPPLAVGMFVNATIQGRLFKNVVQIPREAIRGRNTVIVVDPDDRLRLRKVVILRQSYDTAILRSGLRDGERLCLSPLATVADGMRVRVQPEGTVRKPRSPANGEGR